MCILRSRLFFKSNFLADLFIFLIAEKLLASAADGVFVVRRARRAGAAFPFSLSVAYATRCYHLPIRHTDGETSVRYSLGKGTAFGSGVGSRSNRAFDTLDELVRFYMEQPLLLVTAKDGTAGGGRQPLLLRLP